MESITVYNYLEERMELNILVICLVAFLAVCEGTVTLPRIFKDGMVLQGSPLQANVYGNTDSQENITVSLICQSGRNPTPTQAAINGTSFSALIGPIDSKEICSVVILQSGSEVILNNVLFGDVFICSGESNMAFPMKDIFNASQIIQESASYVDIRMYNVADMTSETEQDDLLVEDWDEWYDASDSGHLREFSAVCFLAAKNLNELYLPINGPKPVGLIGSYFDNTRIEAWSPRESLDACGIAENIDSNDPKNSNSYLYNAMIHPLTKLSIKGFLWYQGETNTEYDMEDYDCTFSNMISSWRQRWHDRTNGATQENAPFGFAQLGAGDLNPQNYNYPITRWKQSGNIGYTPNYEFENVFMTMALDTYDADSGIYSKDKQTIGYRLALGLLHNAYIYSGYPNKGPRPVLVDTVDNRDGTFTANITFDYWHFNYNPIDNSGFYVCTLQNDVECDDNYGSWELLDMSNVRQETSPSSQLLLTFSSETTVLAYLWEATPVVTPLGAPIYANDVFALPSAPFKFAVRLGQVELVQ